jgi:hypothetical protein
MRTTARTLAVAAASLLLAPALAGCGLTHRGGGPPPLVPMPSTVPSGPSYTSADAVVADLGRAGLGCRVVRRGAANGIGGSSVTCVSTLHGVTFENDISVLNPDVFSRDDVGDSIASRREPPFSETIVAAGNWFVDVGEPRFAPELAHALHGTVLPAHLPRIPRYPLPQIPSGPRYRSVADLADDLDAAVGCTDRSSARSNELSCTTGSRAGRSPNCATLSLYPGAGERDRSLRTAIAYRGVPATLATAGNCSVNLCDYGLGTRVAKALHGVVVSYDGE